jgi:hypothetical protein
MTRVADPMERLRGQRPPGPVAMSEDERNRLLSAVTSTAIEQPTRHRRRWLAAMSLATVAVVAAVVGVVVATGTRGTPGASAAIEHRLRNLAVVHAANGVKLDSSDATILGSSPTSLGVVYLVTGFQLINDETDQCIGLLASHPLNDSFSQLPGSSLYFGNYSCGDGGGSFGTGDLVDADAVFMYGHAPDSNTVRVALVGPDGSTDLPMRNGYFGTIVPYAPMPTKILEYDASGNVTATWRLDPRTFTKGYKDLDQTSPHHTLLGAALPDGTPVTVERTNGEDRFGSYAWWIGVAGAPAKGALWVEEPVAGYPAQPPGFVIDDVVTVGDARVVLVDDLHDTPVTAQLDDGTAVPLDFHAVGPDRSLALVVLSGDQLSHSLKLDGLIGYADGSKAGSYTIDLASSAITSSPPPS